MPLNQHTRRVLRGVLGNQAGEDVADVIDAGSGTLAAATEHKLKHFVPPKWVADDFITAVEAGSALSGTVQAKLGQALGDRGAASDIATELAAE